MYIHHSLDSTSRFGFGLRGYTMNNPRNASKGLELSCGLAAALLGACAAAPGEPVSEKLDPDTATTVTILSHPIELLSANRSKQMDPFAYIAPFEHNRMGDGV